MEEKSKKIYFLFQTTRKVILAERECRQNGLKCLAVPVPREYSSECGIALELDIKDKDKVAELLKIRNIEFKEYDNERII